jgi:hypothetical protein
MNLIPLGRDTDYTLGRGEMGHTLDLDLLPDAPVILDAGCSGFGFSTDVLKMYPRARVIAVDPNPMMEQPNLPGCEYFQVALVGSNVTQSGYVRDPEGDGGGNFLAPIDSPKDKVTRPGCNWDFTRFELHKVMCYNIQALMAVCNVTHWDAVKLDIEELEFQVLEKWPGPIATQISVEFHDFTGPIFHSVQAGYYERTLWPHLFQWYRIARHELMDLDGDPKHLGHWDSLLVMK